MFKLKVLIIDDDARLRYTLSEICKHPGWVPFQAENGYQGLQLLLEERMDMILADYHMPEMDGMQFVKEARKQDPHIPILVLTVDERQEIADRFLEEGASDFALKPVKAPDIIARMKLHARLANIATTQEEQEDIFVTKGISKTTLSHIVHYLKQNKEPISVDEISDEIGLAYPTVYRYIMYLLEIGKVKQSTSYQKIGRPKKVYQWFS
ncbi:response regulator [Aquibacillus sp. 3ASR75-11]|uniref:Response regulator n=1 Tax=Terrihalobacillus insolitus TaxID=2950438 RepID=A0A9X4AL13_9BACI|nr:response regulator [Terrihalobacillus insolitus]MDC3411914.1 response regulator [Terrihalobacillus insolitus]MDC3423399.1 response regulator [Terrihalobacillus insolitus]